MKNLTCDHYKNDNNDCNYCNAKIGDIYKFKSKFHILLIKIYHKNDLKNNISVHIIYDNQVRYIYLHQYTGTINWFNDGYELHKKHHDCQTCYKSN